jgi:hypothetical protein
MPVAPLHEGEQHRPQVLASGRQPVLVTRRMLLVSPALQQPLVDEPEQPRVQDVARDPKAALEVIEAMHAAKRIAQDQDRPALADHFQRTRDRAVLVAVRAMKHMRSVKRRPSARTFSDSSPATPMWQHLGVTHTETLVQLSEELLARLDTRVAREGRSRSELICEALAGYLSFEDREAEIDRLMIEGYTRRPQEDRLGADAAARAMVAVEPWEQPAR